MHRGEVVVTVHPEISTIRAEGKYSEQPFWFQVLSGGSYCKVREGSPTSTHDTTFQSRARSLEKSGCNESITSTAITRDVACLFLRSKEYIRSELDCRFKGSTHLNVLCMNLPLSPYWFNPYKLWLNVQKFKKWYCAKPHTTSPLHPTQSPALPTSHKGMALTAEVLSVLLRIELNAPKPRCCTPSSNTDHRLRRAVYGCLHNATLRGYRYVLPAAFSSFNSYFCWLIASHLRICMLVFSEL